MNDVLPAILRPGRVAILRSDRFPNWQQPFRSDDGKLYIVQHWPSYGPPGWCLITEINLEDIVEERFDEAMEAIDALGPIPVLSESESRRCYDEWDLQNSEKVS